MKIKTTWAIIVVIMLICTLSIIDATHTTSNTKKDPYAKVYATKADAAPRLNSNNIQSTAIHSTEDLEMTVSIKKGGKRYGKYIKSCTG